MAARVRDMCMIDRPMLASGQEIRGAHRTVGVVGHARGKVDRVRRRAPRISCISHPHVSKPTYLSHGIRFVCLQDHKSIEGDQVVPTLL